MARKSLSFRTIFLSLLILLYMNSFFVPFLGYDFNPAKLLIFILSPILIFDIISSKQKILYKNDIVMGLFIIGIAIKSLYFSDLHYLTSLSNFLLPYLVYKYYQIDQAKNVNYKIIIYALLLIASTSCILGLIEFQTGEYIIFNKRHPFKIIYAQDYFYNPFRNLFLLPHGFFQYSSVLGNALIFPLCILLASKKYLNQTIYYSLLILFITTVFLTFSRFDTLAALTFSIIFLYYFSKKRIINQKRIVVVFITLFLFALLFLFLKSTVTGTFKARIIKPETLSMLYNSIDTYFIGGQVADIKEKLMIDIPHNIFLYTHYAFGILGLLIIILIFRVIRYNYKYIKKNIHLFYENNNNIKLLISINIFLFYDIFIRGFNYYIFDGFREIFTIFLCIIISDILIRDNESIHNHSCTQ